MSEQIREDKLQRVDMGVYGLSDKVAIVTGAGAGIGKGIALEMCRVGADVVVGEMNPSSAENTVNEIKDLGGRAIKVIVDVRKFDQVNSMIQSALNEYGTIDILVNNVGGLLGIKRELPFLEISEDFWDAIIDENLKGTFLCTKAFMKVIMDQEKKGSIVNVSSLSDRIPYLPVLAYGAAKAGVSNFTMNLAVELSKFNVRVNAVCPGRIDTELTAELYRDRPEIRRAQLKYIPLGRFGTPEDVARPVVFLASEAAGFISGVTIVVSGGATSI